MRNERYIQPETFEFESESPFGEFESEVGYEGELSEFAGEALMAELAAEAPFGEFETESGFGELETGLQEFESNFGEFETGFNELESPVGELAGEFDEFETGYQEFEGGAPGAGAAVCPPCPVISGFVACPAPGAPPTAILDEFATNGRDLSPRHRPVTDSIVARIIQSQGTRAPIRSILIVGHTDREGDNAYNCALGRDRARSAARALLAELNDRRPEVIRRLTVRLASCGECQPRSATVRDARSRRVEIFLPPAQAGCPPFRERVRLHLKLLVQPSRVTIARMLQAMRQVYGPAGFRVELASQEVLRLPALEELSLPLVRLLPCATANLHPEQVALFRNRNNVGPNDIAVYFVRQTTPGVRGNCNHPVGRPGVVITANATEWTLAHEVGHVLGLAHVNNTNRMMHRSTIAITNPPPDLIPAEIATMGASALTIPC